MAFVGRWKCLSRGQGLRIVHDHGVAIRQVKPAGILEHDLFVDRLLHVGELDAFALQAHCEAFLVQLKKAGVPWICRQPVWIPSAFIMRVSGVRISETPPP